MGWVFFPMCPVLCAEGAAGAGAAPAPLPDCAVLHRVSRPAAAPGLVAAVAAWRAAAGDVLADTQFSSCRWRRIVLHVGSWVELDGGTVAHVRGILGGSDVGADGGAHLVVEKMARLPCAQVFYAARDAGIGAALDAHGFAVLRNRHRVVPGGAIDWDAAHIAVVGVAAVRALRLVTEVFLSEGQFIRAGHCPRGGMLNGWLRRAP